MRIAFVLNDLSLSGGTNVVLQHASRLSRNHGHEVSLLLREHTSHNWESSLTESLEVLGIESLEAREWDVAIATYWETLLLLGQVEARSYLWFCQLYEDRFFPDRNPQRTSMQIAGSLPIPVVTEAHWLKNLFEHENPSRQVEVVLNGIDKAIFNNTSEREAPDGEISVLIEGSLDSLAKNTAYAIESALTSNRATRITHVGNRAFGTNDPRYTFTSNDKSFREMADLYLNHDVLLKTSLAEGMLGPPLEALHCGTPFISTPVTGIEEYAKFGVNSLEAPWDDRQAIGKLLDKIATDSNLWFDLHKNGVATALEWPGWDKQTQLFERAITKLIKDPKLNQHDLAALGRTIEFGDLMHWLAMRRLSDKKEGISLLEKHAAHHNQAGHFPAPGDEGIPGKLKRTLRRLIRR